MRRRLLAASAGVRIGVGLRRRGEADDAPGRHGGRERRGGAERLGTGWASGRGGADEDRGGIDAGAGRWRRGPDGDEA